MAAFFAPENILSHGPALQGQTPVRLRASESDVTIQHCRSNVGSYNLQFNGVQLKLGYHLYR